MTAKQLPPRPNLDQLKRQAKDLLESARRNEPGARARFRALPALASASDETLERAPLALHDAQSVIAREHGFHSWNALRDHVEAVTLELDAAVGQFLEAATDGRGDRAERILALHPAIANATLYTALVLGDAHRVDARLDQDPSLATKRLRRSTIRPQFTWPWLQKSSKLMKAGLNVTQARFAFGCRWLSKVKELSLQAVI